MKLRRSIMDRFLMAALFWPVCAQASYHFHNARLDWFSADFIGWVRVEQDVTGQVPSEGQSRVKLRVIEQVKGDAIETLRLVYTDQLVGDPKRDIFVLVPAGDQHSWKDDIGKEFFVYLGRYPSGEFGANAGSIFQIEKGAVVGLPSEYRENYRVSESPRISTLLAKIRAKRPDASVRIGQPLLASPLGRGFRRIEAPHESIERFRRAMLKQRAAEAKQSIYQTESFTNLEFIRHIQEEAVQKIFTDLKVVGEAVSGDYVIAHVVDRGSSDPWYLIREKSRWRILHPWPKGEKEMEELGKLERCEEFRLLAIVLAKQTGSP